MSIESRELELERRMTRCHSGLAPLLYFGPKLFVCEICGRQELCVLHARDGSIYFTNAIGGNERICDLCFREIARSDQIRKRENLPREPPEACLNDERYRDTPDCSFMPKHRKDDV